MSLPRSLNEVFHAHVQRLELANQRFDVQLTRNEDGTMQADSAAIERNYELLRDVCSCMAFRVPTSLELGRALASLDASEQLYNICGSRSRRAHLVWVQEEAEKYHLLSHVNRRCQRSRTSKFNGVNKLKQMYWSMRGKEPAYVNSVAFQQHLDDLAAGRQAIVPFDDLGMQAIGPVDSPTASNTVLALGNGNPPLSDSKPNADVVDLVSDDDCGPPPSYPGDSSSDEVTPIPIAEQMSSAAPLPKPPPNLEVAAAAVESEPIEVPAPKRKAKTGKGEKQVKTKGKGNNQGEGVEIGKVKKKGKGSKKGRK